MIKSAIADVVDKFDIPMVKVTGGQRIDLLGIEKEDLPAVWADLNGAGMVSGFMAEVPPKWRSLLGGPALTGNCCIPIISRTSFGPAAFAFNPSRLGTTATVPDTPLLYYPQNHTTIGAWDASWNPRKGVYFGGGTTVRGLVFPRRTRSVLFFGRHGLGKYCYGPGTADQKMAGQPADGGVDRWCFDPASESKGTHAYPYGYYVWAYDANELAAVKAGRVPPWEVKPYDAWQITLPFSSSGSAVLNGAAYDPATGRIFVSQAFGDGELPVIQVLVIRVP